MSLGVVFGRDVQEIQLAELGTIPVLKAGAGMKCEGKNEWSYASFAGFPFFSFYFFKDLLPKYNHLHPE